MLANMVRANSKSKVVDLCAGGGIISILIALKTVGCKAIFIFVAYDKSSVQTQVVQSFAVK